MPIRTFLALDLDEHILDGLCNAQRELTDPADKIKWVERENLHVTLKFLGDVPEDLLATVCNSVARAAAAVPSFDFDVRGLVCTPTYGPLRMVWGLVADNSGLMSILHDELDKALSPLGLKAENRDFHPHITLARIKYVKTPARFRAAVQLYQDFDFGVQGADQVSAYNSQLTDAGPVYTPLCRSNLGR